MNIKRTTSSIGLASFLTLIFVVLKLIPNTPLSNWSWIWVLSPLWISILLSLAFFIIFFGVILIAGIIIAIVRK